MFESKQQSPGVYEIYFRSRDEETDKREGHKEEEGLHALHWEGVTNSIRFVVTELHKCDYYTEVSD